MSDPNDPQNNTAAAPNPSPPSAHHRRRGSSFAGQNFADLYEAAKTRQASDGMQSATSPQFPTGSISSAFQAHRRRLSLSTVGLGNTAGNNPTPSFAGFGAHRDSNTSTSTVSIDEQAIDDDGGGGGGGSGSMSAFPSQQQQPGATPFARRMSFGARALRDAKTGPASGRPMNGRSSLSSHSPVQQHAFPAFPNAPSPDSAGAKPSFGGRGGDSSMSWVDSFVNRGDRRASVTFPPTAPQAPGFKPRTQSAVEAAQSTPVPAMPKRAQVDTYGDRILRGDLDL